MRKDRVTGELVLASRGTDGHTPVHVTSVAYESFDANYDGTRVLFLSEQWTGDGYRNQVLVHDLSQGKTIELGDGSIEPDSADKVVMTGNGAGAVILGQAAEPESPRHVFIVNGQQTPKRMPCPPEFCDRSTAPRSFDDLAADEAGKTILYSIGQAGTSKLIRFDIQSGATSNLTPAYERNFINSEITSPAITRDGTTLAAAYSYFNGWNNTTLDGIARSSTGSTLVGNDSVIFPQQQSMWIRLASISEDGRVIAYTKSNGDSTAEDHRDYLYVYDADEGTETQVNLSVSQVFFGLEMADNPTIVIWTDSSINGIWGRALGA